MQKYILILALLLFVINSYGARPSARGARRSPICDFQYVGDLINKAKTVVPKKIYHFGKYEHLIEDVQARTIPQNVWDKFIMGDTGRFELKRSRKGLYGTGSLMGNNYGSPEYSWVMEIWIKEECRKPEYVATPIGLNRSPRFLDWLKRDSDRSNTSKEDFLKNCLTDKGDLSLELFFGAQNQKCDEAFNRYLEETNAKVVQDVGDYDSYYIRDRSCIKTIKGTPKEIIKIAYNSFSWVPICPAEGLQTFMYYVVSKAMRLHGRPVSSRVATKILENSALGDWPGLDDLTQTPWLNAYIRCLKVVNGFDKFQALQAKMESKEMIDKIESGLLVEQDSIDQLWNSLCN